MFGYVKTDNPNMYVKDTILYKAMYCGLCKSIGRECGQKGRLALNYDLTFLSIWAHNICGIDVNIEKKRCAIHWFSRRPIAKDDSLTKRIANLNLILAYYKLNDDVLDSKKGRLKRIFFKSPYKKAIKKEPKFNEIVKRNYKVLTDYEASKGNSIDIASDSFGKMMRELVLELLNDKFTFAIGEVAYNLGKWIYLIDALDDFDKDKKKGEYNVFVNFYKDCKSKNDLMLKFASDLHVIFGTILSDIIEYNSQIEYKFNKDLLDNVFINGLKKQTIMIMENKPCKKTTKY